MVVFLDRSGGRNHKSLMFTVRQTKGSPRKNGGEKNSTRVRRSFLTLASLHLPTSFLYSCGRKVVVELFVNEGSEKKNYYGDKRSDGQSDRSIFLLLGRRDPPYKIYDPAWV